ncbi:MAG: hypothetical protein Tsb0034_13500 [Ekhidna sp.]
MEDLDLSVFEHADKAQWIQLAQDQLKGEDPLQKLRWNTGGIEELLPYYDQSDIEDLGAQISFFEALPPHRWKLFQRVVVKDERQANKEALAALEGGCDGVIFEVDASCQKEALLTGINLEICDVSLAGDQTASWEGTFASTRSNTYITSEIVSAISQVADLMENATSNAYLVRPAFADFFLEIASVRALRYLLGKASEHHIHSSVPPHSSEEYQWFLNTTAGLASILGGSHSIELHTAIGDPRISRNVGNLIREESKIEIYSDQCGGSYLVESLTEKIIRGVKEALKK